MKNTEITSAKKSEDYIITTEEGISPDTNEDLSNQISSLLTKSHDRQKGIYFPAGTYLFSQDVLLTSFNSLIGSEEGTIFRCISDDKKSIMFGDSTYSSVVTDLNIQNIIFDNIRVHFYGRKSNINVNHNVFINTVTETDIPQLTCSTSAYGIKGNIFMRGRGYPGVGLSTYGNSAGLVIEQNFLGSVSDIKLATPWIDDNTKTMLATLLELRKVGKMTFDDAQGDFVTGWYATSNLRKGIFRQNFFAGSTEIFLFNPKTEPGKDPINIPRDHCVYIKQYDHVEVVQNYFSGWPKNDRASGQLKFRNAKGLVFAGNYLNGLSFNARPYDNVDNQWLIMQDTFIFNNYLSDGMISYWQNFKDSEEKAINVKDYLVFSNQFIHRDNSKPLVTSPSTSLSADQFLCSENIFVETGELVKIDGVLKEKALSLIKARLPDYATQYLSIKPIMPLS